MIDSSLPAGETNANCFQNLMLCGLVCILFCTAVNKKLAAILVNDNYNEKKPLTKTITKNPFVVN